MGLETVALTFLIGGFGAIIQKYWPHIALGKTEKQATDEAKAQFIDESVEQIIVRIAKQESVDPILAVKVATCESSLNPKAILVNTDGSRDRGIFQINDKYHPEVTDQQAFNPEFSAKFFCEAFKGGHISYWNASRKCWET